MPTRGNTIYFVFFFLEVCTVMQGGRYSSVGIAIRYGLDCPGIYSRWGRDFPRPSRPALGPTQSPVQWVPGLSLGGKAAGEWCWPPTHHLQCRGLKKGRAIPLPALRDLVAYTGANLYLYLTIMQSVFVAGCDGASLSGVIKFQHLDIGMYLWN